MVSFEKSCTGTMKKAIGFLPIKLGHIIIRFLHCFFSGVESSNGWCPGGTDRLSAGAVAHQQGQWCQGAGCPPRCCALPAGAVAGCFPLPETPFPFPPAWTTRRGAANQPQWLCPRRGLCAVSISKDYLNSCSLCHILTEFFSRFEIKNYLFFFFFHSPENLPLICLISWRRNIGSFLSLGHVMMKRMMLCSNPAG